LASARRRRDWQMLHLVWLLSLLLVVIVILVVVVRGEMARMRPGRQFGHLWPVSRLQRQLARNPRLRPLLLEAGRLRLALVSARRLGDRGRHMWLGSGLRRCWRASEYVAKRLVGPSGAGRPERAARAAGVVIQWLLTDQLQRVPRRPAGRVARSGRVDHHAGGAALVRMVEACRAGCAWSRIAGSRTR
jgi:hypothetical protein